jgi:hypothetical protein
MHYWRLGSGGVLGHAISLYAIQFSLLADCKHHKRFINFAGIRIETSGEKSPCIQFTTELGKQTQKAIYQNARLVTLFAGASNVFK